MSDDYTIWEYRLERMQATSTGPSLDVTALQQSGVAGWELCAVSRDLLIFKRPKGCVMARTIPNAEWLRQAAGEAP